MVISKHSLSFLAAVALALATPGEPVRAQQAPAASETHAALGGIWVISPDAYLRGPDSVSAPSGGSGGSRRGGGGGGRGYGGGGGGGGYGGGSGSGGGGGGGYGGGGGRGGGGRGGGRGEGNGEREAIANYSRTLLQPVKQMTIVPHEASLAIAYDDGRTLTLEATNKKVSSRVENGLVKLTRKSRWMGDAMISEIEIENGPKLEEKYEVIAEGSQLRVSITAEGGGRDEQKRTITHVYERPSQ